MILPGIGTSNKDYVEFLYGNSCGSLAGRDGGRQNIFLAPVCAEEHSLIRMVDFVSKQNTNLTILSDPACSRI